ncbi:MAG: hypothetical protein QM696_06895 [Steroidobacteraceae bacterium]
MLISGKLKAALILSVGLAGLSQVAPAATPVHPDFSGSYVGLGGPGGDSQPSDQTGFVNTPKLGELFTAALQPWAKVRADSTNTQIEDMAAICSFNGPFRHTNSSPFMWIQKDDQAYFIPNSLTVVGVIRIFMTDKHPKDIAPSWEGHSIGHWEGDTLVVDTIGFNDQSWLGSENQPHTEALHLVRRIRMVGDGRIMEIKTVAEDRRALKHPVEFVRYYRKTDADFAEYVCNEEPGQMREWYDVRQEAVKWEKTHPPKYEDQ